MILINYCFIVFSSLFVFILCDFEEFDDYLHRFEDSEKNQDALFNSILEYKDIPKLSGLGMKCETDFDCSDGAVCSNKKCHCVPGRTQQGDERCVLGNRCSSNDDCVALHATCNEKQICECSKKFHLEGSACILIQVLGQDCKSDEDCIYPDELRPANDAHCISGKCSCLDHMLTDGNFCLKFPMDVDGANYTETWKTIYTNIIPHPPRGNDTPKAEKMSLYITFLLLLLFIMFVFGWVYCSRSCTLS